MREQPSPLLQILNTVYAALGAFIFSVYLIVDTQAGPLPRSPSLSASD